MTNPLTPPPELVQQWMEQTSYDEHTWFYESYIAEQAAKWGWDQREPEIQADVDAELEACCEWLRSNSLFAGDVEKLRATRRPKPPSLKEQALEGLTRIESTNDFFSNQMKDLATIRRALETLPE